MADRIAKVLAARGIASRRGVEAMIAAGRVQVNGVLVTTPATLLNGDEQIALDNKPVASAALPVLLFRFHKPKNCLTTAHDPEGRQTVFDLLPKNLPRLQAVGRLDFTSEGLLLFTTSGALKRYLELPRTGLKRRYRVRVHGRVDADGLKELQHGITVDGVRYGAIEAALERQQGSNAWLTMTLQEGKNREIRKICESLGYTVNRLIRTEYGAFTLGQLEPGALNEVAQPQLKAAVPPEVWQELGGGV